MSSRYLIMETILELYTPLDCFLNPVNSGSGICGRERQGEQGTRDNEHR